MNHPFIFELEGLDGAGKSTQISLLKQFLEARQIQYEYIHFPRFDAPIYGDLIARFLRGELGPVDQVDPYIVALLYAGDRANATPMIKKWGEEGKFVILDRYVYSNIAFQCAKLPVEKREKLKNWILELEFEYNGLLKPDLALLLDVPFSFTERKLTQTRDGEDREYLQGNKDIHEESLDLQRRVKEVYSSLVVSENNFHIINCSDSDGEMLPPQKISGMVCSFVEQLIG